MEIRDNCLNEAVQQPSAFYNERPDPTDISLLVIHNISLPPNCYGQLHNHGHNYITDLFLGQLNPERHPYFREIHQMQVSAHLLITREGEMIQYVPFDKRAWHAGISEFNGRPACNDFAIGIELEGCDSDCFSAAQYQCLTAVTRALFQQYPKLTLDRIAGHSDIAPGRKTDPGPGFDWVRYREGLK